MNINVWTAAAVLLTSSTYHSCEAFLRPPSSSIQRIPNSSSPSSSRLYGIQEWRDQALEYKYTLDSYNKQSGNNSDSTSATTATPAVVPILPFPFTDILLQGQRTQLNLYEQRFHELFTDAMDNHCGMIGMGLLAGNGMITTLPLCEVESFSRFGSDNDWKDEGNEMGQMGNGSIFVTIRAVSRCKIIEGELIQEEPYMKARVVELLDDDSMSIGGVREKSNVQVEGESSALSVASSVAGNIENLMVSLASMEHKLKEMEDGKKKKSVVDQEAKMDGSAGGEKENGNQATKEDEVMNRRLVNAQLESLFMQDSSEGIEVDTENTTEDDIDDEDDDDEEDELSEDEVDFEQLDRVAQFQRAFEMAKETDTFGYVLQPTTAVDNLSQTTFPDSPTKQSSAAVRSPKDLTAISWAAFCTGEKDSIQRDVMKIQALDMTNVLQRLQLASAMLREEKKKWVAKLALAGIQSSDDDGNDEEDG